MRVMFVVEQYAEEGSRYYRDFFRCLRDLGDDVVVVNLAESAMFEADAREHMSAYHPLALPGGYYRGISPIRKLVRAQRPDVIQAMETIPAFYTALALMSMPAAAPPLVYGRRHGRTQGGLARLMDRIAVARSDKVIAVSPATARIAGEEHPSSVGKITSVLSGVALQAGTESDAPQAGGARPFTVLLLSRLRRVKGHGVAMAAAGLLRDRGIDARFLFVGDGPERAALEEEATALGLGDRVVFAGHTEDVASVFRQADVSIVPSFADAFPKVAVESFAAGVPLVASSVQGLENLVRDGENGLLVPVGDAQALAVAIARLHDEPELARRLADRAHADYVKSYTPETMTRAYRSIYESVCREAEPR
jgi:glycosyltransferase involved in cell wall biosynthesis